MDSLPYPIMTNVLEVINASSEYPDHTLVRQKTLDVLFRTLSAEGAIFILPDENALSTYIMVKNLDLKYTEAYNTYYHQFDPLNLLQGICDGKKMGSVLQVRGYSYDSMQPAEYYSDFLMPQKIHHKLIINLVAEQKMYGRIVLMRSRKSYRYTGEEIRLAKAISPFLAHALAHYHLRKNITLKGNILRYIEKHSAIGMILLDEKLHIIYINKKAEEFCSIFQSSVANGYGRDHIPSQLLMDCRKIKSSLKTYPAACMAIPRKRTVCGPNHSRFAISSRAFDQETGGGSSPIFMLSITEMTPAAEINFPFLMDSYHLSKREIDVAELLFSGLKNSEIADKLFISEITVKKHLQNIYNKVEVNNRTSLINKMLTH